MIQEEEQEIERLKLQLLSLESAMNTPVDDQLILELDQIKKGIPSKRYELVLYSKFLSGK